MQETANKYVDNNYAISARSIIKSDLEQFHIDSKSGYWLSTIEEDYILYRENYDIRKEEIKESDKLYIIPYIKIQVSNTNDYSIGNNYNIELNGISEWIIINKEDDNISLIQKTPIEMNANIERNLNQVGQDTIDLFKQSDVLEGSKGI